MSVKQQFRCEAGCCICGTKSSTSRFTASKEYENAFPACFGPESRRRSGDICNACVLCVKRHRSKAGDKQFRNVLDSRKGPGPKNLKQINKRKKRKEQREAANKAKLQMQQMALAGSSGCGVSSRSCSSGSCNSSTGLSSVSTVTTGAVLRSATAAAAAAGAATSTPCSSEVGQFTPGSGGSDDSISSFRVPNPPASSSTSCVAMSTPRNYYKKRVIMKPMKMPDSEEIDELYQEVRRNSSMMQDGSFDMPQIHHAMMNQKRRRMLGSDGGSVASSTDSFTSELSNNQQL